MGEHLLEDPEGLGEEEVPGVQGVLEHQDKAFPVQ